MKIIKLKKLPFPRPLVNPTVIAEYAWAAMVGTEGKGAIIECGVFDGCTTIQVFWKLLALPYKMDMYAADTFAGFPYSPENPFVISNLETFGIKPLVGKVEDTLPKLPKKLKFSFVFCDLDLAVPMEFCVNFFQKRIVKGGIIGFHDYGGNDQYSGITKVVDDGFGNNKKFEEVVRTKKRGRDGRLIFFEKIK